MNGFTDDVALVLTLSVSAVCAGVMLVILLVVVARGGDE